MRHYDYCDAVLPALLKRIAATEPGLLHPCYAKNGPMGTVTAHGDKWMEDRELARAGIPDYKQICLYLVFRCLDRDDAHGYRHEDVVSTIKELYAKYRKFIPDFSSLTIQVSKREHPALEGVIPDELRKFYEVKSRFSFDGLNWTPWQDGYYRKGKFKSEFCNPEWNASNWWLFDHHKKEYTFLPKIELIAWN